MIRMILFIINLGITTVFGGIAVIVIGFFQKYSQFSYQVIARAWARIIVFIAGSRVRVRGQEHIDSKQPYIAVCNHQSNMDIPIVIRYLPLRMTIIAKKELFAIPIFGQAMRAVGILEIDRSNRHKAMTTLKIARQVMEERRISVLAFPEGTRSRDGEIKPFKKGPFMLALESGVPLLPVTIKGTFPILPAGKFKVKPGDVDIIIHPPVDPAKYGVNNRNQLIADIHQQISEGFYAETTVTDGIRSPADS